jgi:hypothetical protein
MKKTCLAALTICLAGMAPLAQAEVGMGIRVGPFTGLGADVDIGLTENLNLRLGYNWLGYDEELEDTDVTYDAELQVNSFSAMLDWHAFAGGFRFSFGAFSSGPKLDLVGTPTGGTYEIGDNTYTAAQIGDLRGEIEIGDSISPYFGIGYGNAVKGNSSVTFLFDLGVIYTDEPKVTLTARCGTGVSPIVCAQIQSDVNTEIAEIKEDAKDFEFYPVISIGIGIRF